MEVYKVIVFAHAKVSARYYPVATFSAKCGCPATAADRVARKYRGNHETNAELVVAIDHVNGRHAAVKV